MTFVFIHPSELEVPFQQNGTCVSFSATTTLLTFRQIIAIDATRSNLESIYWDQKNN